jgi:hypothetical protein
MRSNTWSRILVVLSFFALSSAQADTPPGQEPGTRVTVKLAEASGELPEAEKLVQSLEAVGGEHLVKVTRRKADGQQELTVDLWGNTVPQADIPQTLRDAFPVLSSADIQVATLEAKDRPKLDGEGRPRRGEKGTPVKRVVKIIKQKEE